ncbi:MAG: Ldh family oxidoreductase, partial [Candidatus Latescibacteria bacterium]|nr:Ldh family oxidoreductase [Candidatus Latescibacterota bacterium]
MAVVPFNVLNDLSYSIFNATGIPEDDARILADHLTTSNLVGHDSHGVWFMPHYVPGLQKNYKRWEEHIVTREQPSFVLI